MAIRKTLVDCLFNISKTYLLQNPIAASCRLQTPLKPTIQHLLHHNKMKVKPEIFPLLIGDKLTEKFERFNGQQIRFNIQTLAFPVKQEAYNINGKNLIFAKEVEKVLQRKDFGVKQGLELAQARVHNEYGDVIILGNLIFLHPEQVAKAIKSVIPQSPAEEEDLKREELRELAQRKANIDERAKALVQKEMWCGLAFMVVQTVGFMRLTFWELSWDVMEPICFYVASIYFMFGYAFFLRTSRDPSFEGFYKSRFTTKQKLLMKSTNFDIQRFNELCRAIHPSARPRECCFVDLDIPRNKQEHQTQMENPNGKL